MITQFNSEVDGNTLFRQVEQLGETPSYIDRRVNIVSTSESGRSLVRDFEIHLSRYRFGSTNFDGIDVRIFISNRQEDIIDWKKKLNPGANELCLLVWNNDEVDEFRNDSPAPFPRPQGNSMSDIVFGEDGEEVLFEGKNHGFVIIGGTEFNTFLNDFQSFDHTRKDQRWFKDQWSVLGQPSVLESIKLGAEYVGVGLEDAFGVLSYISELNNVFYHAVQTVFPSAAELIDKFETLVKDSLFSKVESILSSKFKSDAFDFTEEGGILVDYVTSLVDDAANSIPSVDYLMQLFWTKLTQRYDYTDPISSDYNFSPKDFEEAKQIFEEQIILTVASPRNLKKIGGGIFGDLQKHQSEIGSLIVGAPIVGGPLFIIGTLWQIIYDIVSALIMIAQYGYHAVGGVYSYLTAPATDEETWAQTDEGTMNSLFPSFDEAARKKFIDEDLPKIIEDIKAFVKPLMEDFIINSKYYGQAVGDFIAEKILANTADGVFMVMTTPYPSNGGFFSKVWWVITQYFNFGAMLGPLIVDVALFFCSGGVAGVFSAAAKIGKIDKLGDALRFTQRTADTIKATYHFTEIINMIPARLKVILTELFEKLWNWVGNIVEQIKSVLRLVNDSLPAAKKLSPDRIDEYAEALDKWYDRVQLINLLVAIGLLVFGTDTKVNSEGKLALNE